MSKLTSSIFLIASSPFIAVDTKKLFDIMVLIEDNVIINDENILEWFNIKYV